MSSAETHRTTDLAQRLAAVERADADLQRQVGYGMASATRVARFAGALKDEPAFPEVVAYGRALPVE